MTPYADLRARLAPRCQLCADCGQDTPATVLVTIPMAGHRPRYPLCDACLSDIGAECEDVRVLR